MDNLDLDQKDSGGRNCQRGKQVILPTFITINRLIIIIIYSHLYQNIPKDPLKSCDSTRKIKYKITQNQTPYFFLTTSLIYLAIICAKKVSVEQQAKRACRYDFLCSKHTHFYLEKKNPFIVLKDNYNDFIFYENVTQGSTANPPLTPIMLQAASHVVRCRI